jgi:hypothetical protein
MSHRDKDGTFWIVPEPPGRCELCGAVEETRPYGPNGAQICFDCGEKNPEETRRQFERAVRMKELDE